jgi:pyroglutamyl-peptidase
MDRTNRPSPVPYSPIPYPPIPLSMSTQCLITTFTTWLPHQRSNAADDLVARVAEAGLPPGTELLRHLPVDSQASWTIVEAAMQRFRPARIIACGMAESRDRLCLEQQARRRGQIRRSSIDLAPWAAQLQVGEQSFDAGDFVCNDLYFSILEAIDQTPALRDSRAFFLHVPPIEHLGDDAIRLVQDFQTLLTLP